METQCGRARAVVDRPAVASSAARATYENASRQNVARHDACGPLVIRTGSFETPVTGSGLQILRTGINNKNNILRRINASIRPTEQVKFHWTEQRASNVRAQRPEIQHVWVCKYTSVDENMVRFRHIYAQKANRLIL